MNIAATATGTGVLVRFMLRRDRVRLPVWLGSITALVLLTTVSLEAAYPTQADIRSRAEVVTDNPAAIAFTGPAYGLDSFGGMLSNELLGFGAVIVALMSIFLFGRHTRAEEENERVELLRSGVLGRRAPMLAALIVVSGSNVLLGVVTTVGLIALGLPTAGSVVWGVSWIGVGLVFMGVAALAAQVSEHVRAANGIAAAVLGVAFVVRAAGDIGDGTASWASPIGWAQAMRPYADEVLWPALLLLVTAAGLVWAADAINARRDLGAGLLRQRPGNAGASAGLRRPVGFALRLQRASVIGWGVGLVLLGATYGSLGQEVERMLEDNPNIQEVFLQADGADLTDAFFSTALTMVALIGSGFALASTLRLRREETTGRAEPLLTTGLSRLRWAASFLSVPVVGTAVLFLVTGVGAGAAFAAAVGDAGEFSRLFAATVVHVPAVLVLVGVGAALFGLAPRALSAVWAYLAFCSVVALLGEQLQLPGWLRALSPFHHTPALPGEAATAGPVVALCAVAVLLVAVGLAGFRRRDLA